MTNYQRTANWLEACGKEPGNSSHLSVQIGVDIEETAELLRNLRVSKEGWARLLERVVSDMESLAGELKRGDLIAHFPQHLKVEVLDGLCDREVTGNGVAYLMEFDKDGADAEVLDSNDSKLNDGVPVILDGGKIGKGKNYFKPNLKRFI